jgi:glycosyltransferase involved in cell wall biosynthesis
MEKVSILIPVYKGALTLRKCVESCLNQTYTDIEIIIVIDGSPDNSFEIATKLSESDKRIKVVNKANEGLPRTRNVAFKNSSGEFIYHLDQDDYIEPETIEILINKLDALKADIVVAGSLYETLEGRKMTQWISSVRGEEKADYLNAIFESKLQPNIWGKLIRRNIYNVVEVIDKHTGGEDYIANVMMICYNQTIKIVPVQDLLHHYVVHDQSLTNTMPAEEFFDFTKVLEEILVKTDLEDKVMDSWAWFRVIKAWRYYLRRGGKQYLLNKNFTRDFYEKYYKIVKGGLSFTEQFELILYKYNQFFGYNFSRIYVKYKKLINRS